MVIRSVLLISIFLTLVFSENCSLKFKFARICNIYKFNEKCFQGEKQFCKLIVTKRDELKCPYYVCKKVDFSPEQSLVKSLILTQNFSVSVFSDSKSPESPATNVSVLSEVKNSLEPIKIVHSNSSNFVSETKNILSSVEHFKSQFPFKNQNFTSLHNPNNNSISTNQTAIKKFDKNNLKVDFSHKSVSNFSQKQNNLSFNKSVISISQNKNNLSINLSNKSVIDFFHNQKNLSNLSKKSEDKIKRVNHFRNENISISDNKSFQVVNNLQKNSFVRQNKSVRNKPLNFFNLKSNETIAKVTSKTFPKNKDYLKPLFNSSFPDHSNLLNSSKIVKEKEVSFINKTFPIYQNSTNIYVSAIKNNLDFKDQNTSTIPNNVTEFIDEKKHWNQVEKIRIFSKIQETERKQHKLTTLRNLATQERNKIENQNWLEVQKFANFTKYQKSISNQVISNSSKQFVRLIMEVNCTSKTCKMEFRELPIVCIFQILHYNTKKPKLFRTLHFDI
jgi:hypothetical protein